MRGDPINEAHHVTRVCGKTKVDNGIPSAAAFLLRPNEPDLSVCWLEGTSNADNRHDQLRAVRDALTADGRRPGAESYFAVLLVRNITSITEVRGAQLALRVEETPTDNNPGHASIYDLPPSTSVELANLAGLALSEAVREPSVRCGDL